jgi:predicted acetyltransferase
LAATPSDDLVLRPPGPGDEAVCVAAHREFEAEAPSPDDAFPFLLFWTPDVAWPDYVRLLDGLRDGRAVPEGLVRSSFLLAEAGGDVVGRASLRFELNERLASESGHIGYGVRPRYRRRGYASAILRRGVALLRADGVGPVLVVCDDDNTGSAAVIARGGGVLESVVTRDDGRPPFRRYWIR